MVHLPSLKRRILHSTFFNEIQAFRLLFLSSLTQENIMDNTTNGTNPSNSALAKAQDGKAIDGMLSKASSSAHATVNSIAGAAEEAARKAKPTIDQVTAMAHKAVDGVAGTVAPAADWLAEQGSSLNQIQKKAIDETRTYISANPFKSLAIAAATGYLLSLALRK
jgi:ElaB/YqjD/DUF883 family membrane-anchored ribosome-binding protein